MQVLHSPGHVPLLLWVPGTRVCCLQLLHGEEPTVFSTLGVTLLGNCLTSQ